MEKQLDKLFREKLENHTVIPSADAWGKVSGNLPKKNNKLVLVWRIAAAVALMGVIGWYSLKNSKSNPDQLAGDKTVKQDKIQSETTQPTEKESTIQESKKQLEPAVQQTVNKSMQVVQEQVAQIETPTNQEEIIVTEVEESTKTSAIEETSSATVATIQLPTVELKAKEEKTIVIVYNLASVAPQQEVEPVKTNAFKKVIEFAKNVKGGETTLASVRDWKDNLLGSEEVTRVDKSNNKN